MSIPVKQGDKLRLNLLLDDGNPDLFPIAHVTTEDNIPVAGSPFELVSLGNGRYYDDSYVISESSGYLTATYIVYKDSLLSEESRDYPRAEDIFSLESDELSRSTYAAIMSSVYKDEDQSHEILVWLTRGSNRILDSSDCIVRFYTAEGALVWTQEQETPDPKGMFLLNSGSVSLQKDSNYYVIIEIKDEAGIPRVTTLPMMTVG